MREGLMINTLKSSMKKPHFDPFERDFIQKRKGRDRQSPPTVGYFLIFSRYCFGAQPSAAKNTW